MLEPGELDVGRAVSDGVAAVFRNLLPVIGALVIGVSAYLISICTCVGWIGILPLLMWGLYRFLLDLVDGRAEVGALWSGAQELGHVFVQMWAVTLIWFVIGLPYLMLFLPVAIWPMIQGEPLDPVLAAVVTLVPGTVYGMLLVRFLFAPFLVVDQRVPPWEAFSRSWSVTHGKWLKMAFLQLLFVLLGAPAQVLNVGSQMLSQDLQDDPQAVQELLAPMLAMQLGVIVISGSAAVVGMAIFAAAYRQVVGKRT